MISSGLKERVSFFFVFIVVFFYFTLHCYLAGGCEPWAINYRFVTG